jgi:hypothetical protein
MAYLFYSLGNYDNVKGVDILPIDGITFYSKDVS